VSPSSEASYARTAAASHESAGPGGGGHDFELTAVILAGALAGGYFIDDTTLLYSLLFDRSLDGIPKA
jgi:hypothetical protein